MTAKAQTPATIYLLYGLSGFVSLGVVGFTWMAPRVNIFYSLKLLVWVFWLLVGFVFLVRRDGTIRRWAPATAPSAPERQD